MVTPAGQRTRERIVDAAAQLMFAQGVAGTSIPDVQAAAHVSASQIYHYFGDKQGLVRAVIGRQLAVTLEGQRPLLDHLDTVEDLRAWADAAIAGQVARGCAGGCEIGSLASELVEYDEPTRAELAAAFDQWEAPVRAGLERMAASGVLRPDAPVAELASALIASIQGGLLMTQLRRDPAPFRAATNAAIAYVETFRA